MKREGVKTNVAKHFIWGKGIPPKDMMEKWGKKRLQRSGAVWRQRGQSKKLDRKIEKEKERKIEDGEKEKGNERAYTQAHMQIPSSLG